MLADGYFKCLEVLLFLSLPVLGGGLEHRLRVPELILDLLSTLSAYLFELDDDILIDCVLSVLVLFVVGGHEGIEDCIVEPVELVEAFFLEEVGPAESIHLLPLLKYNNCKGIIVASNNQHWSIGYVIDGLLTVYIVNKSITEQALHELLVGDKAVHVLVGLLHDLIHQLAGQLQAHLLDLVVELAPAYLASAVAVEIGEYVVQVFLSGAEVSVHAAGNELVEVYLAVLVHVHHFQDAMKLPRT